MTKAPCGEEMSTVSGLMLLANGPRLWERSCGPVGEIDETDLVLRSGHPRGG